MSLASPLLLAATWQDKLAAMSWLELILWFGLAGLTVALLALMGTRWGQVRPVSKCAVLSVVAHLLFLCYAYGTRLNLDGGSLAGHANVRVSLLDPDEEPERGPVSSLASTASSPEQLSVDPPFPADLEGREPPPTVDAAAPPEARATPSGAEMEPAGSVPPDGVPDAEPPLEAPPLLAAPSAEPDVAAPAPVPPAAPPENDPADIEIEVPPIPDVVTAPRTEPTSVAKTGPDAPLAAASPGGTGAAEEPVVKPTPPHPGTSPTAAPAPPAPAEGGARADGLSPQQVVASPPAVARRPADGEPLPEPYRLRADPDRLRFALTLGASEQTEAAVSAALDWLAAQQQSDGRWDASEFGAGRETRTLGHDRRGAGADADTGISGLALLAFLGAGETHLAGTHRETVQRGLEFLLRCQHSDGNLAGQARQFERMYCHGIAALALGEAYAMTGDARLLPSLRRAVQYTWAAQDRVSGGWRYQPGDRGDMSQFGWQVMALRSAELGGIATPVANRTLMVKFLDSSTQGSHRGLASYRSGERPTRTMTAEALTCRLFLGLPVSDGTWREAADFLLEELPGQSESNLYYWYYATLALFHLQGESWKAWNESLQRDLLHRQRRSGPLAGSWDTHDVWGGYGGRIYTTSVATLCLEVYYRYLPLYDPDRLPRQAEADPNGLRR